MNCENFNDRLPEYLEDTLSATEREAARAHIQKCVACRQALAQHEALAKSLRLLFKRETERLSLSAEAKRNILIAVRRPESAPRAWDNIQSFFAFLWHPARAGVALLCLVLLISAGRFYLDSIKHSSAPATMKDDRITYVIDIPIQTERHVYREQNNLLVDAVVTETGFIDARFSENMRPAASSQPPIK